MTQLNTDALIEYSRALKSQLKSQKLVSPYLEPPLRWLPRPPPSAKGTQRPQLRGSRAASARAQTQGSTRETSRERPATAKRTGAGGASREDADAEMALADADETGTQPKGQRKGNKKQENELPEDPITLLPTVPTRNRLIF